MTWPALWFIFNSLHLLFLFFLLLLLLLLCSPLSGRAGIVYNGIPDWTYENVPELNGRSSGLAFSPDGLFLAFLTFNDSEVNEYK